jgi:hypothetical protein
VSERQKKIIIARIRLRRDAYSGMRPPKKNSAGEKRNQRNGRQGRRRD